MRYCKSCKYSLKIEKKFNTVYFCIRKNKRPTKGESGCNHFEEQKGKLK